jgi:hypothetical protein
MTTTVGVDVIPLGDRRLHCVPGGYDSQGEGWLALERPSDASYQRCRCSPTLRLVHTDDGSLGTVHVHRAWDGREVTEGE